MMTIRQNQLWFWGLAAAFVVLSTAILVNGAQSNEQDGIWMGLVGILAGVTIGLIGRFIVIKVSDESLRLPNGLGRPWQRDWNDITAVTIRSFRGRSFEFSATAKGGKPHRVVLGAYSQEDIRRLLEFIETKGIRIEHAEGRYP